MSVVLLYKYFIPLGGIGIESDPVIFIEGSMVSSPSESRRTASRTAAVSQSEKILTSSPSTEMRSSDYLDDLKFVG